MAVKKLSELTVAELKHELKKRKLDYTGDRSILISRLRKSLVDENKAKQSQKANEVEGEKKPAEKAQVDQKESESVAGPASVSGESAKASQPEGNSTLPTKSPDADVSAISNSFDITASVSMSDSALEKSILEGAENNSVENQEVQPIKTEENVRIPSSDVLAHTSQDAVSDLPSDLKNESQEVENEKMDYQESEDPSKDKTSGEQAVPEMVDHEAMDVDNKSEQTVTAITDDCPQIAKEQSLELGEKKESDLISSAKVGSESDAAVDLPKDHRANVDDAKKEDTEKVPQSDPSLKTVTEKPEVLESIHVTKVVTAASKINEVKNIEPAKPVSTVNSLWVSGLVGMVKASDVKQAFNQYGRVASAKIVTSAKYPGSSCFGLVTMHSHEDALKCIDAFNGKTILGSLVTVELDMKHRVTKPQQSQVASTELKTGAQPPSNVAKPAQTVAPVVKAPQKQTPPPAVQPSKPEPVKAEVPAPVVVKSEAAQPQVVTVPKSAALQPPSTSAANEKQDVSTSVWLSGFPDTIKAAELKAFCLAAGKVNAAKVVANAKLKTYYGLVTMATVEDAQTCLKKLHNTMYNKLFKIACEMSPSNTVTPELLKHFSKNRAEQASTTATTKPVTTQSSTAIKPVTPTAKPATSSNNNNNDNKVSPRKPDPKNANNGSKRGRKRAPLMKTPASNRNFRRPSPRGRDDITSRYGMSTGRANLSGILDGGLMGRSTFGTNSRSIMDDRRSLVYLEEERRLTQDLAAINAQKDKLALEALRLERERDKMETLRQGHMSMPRRDEWKPLLPTKRPHEDEVCWRPPPHSSAKRFTPNPEHDSFNQMNRRPPLLDERDVRYPDRNAGGSSLLGPRNSFQVNRYSDYY